MDRCSYSEIDGAHDGDFGPPMAHAFKVAHGSGSLGLHLGMRSQVSHHVLRDLRHQEDVLVVEVEIRLKQLRIRSREIRNHLQIMIIIIIQWLCSSDLIT